MANRMDMKKSNILWMGAMLLLAVACSKSDEIDSSGGNVNQEDSTSIPNDPMVETWLDVPALQSMSAADFKMYVVGYGWRRVETYRMNNDATQYSNIPLEAPGMIPSRYAFGEDNATSFSYSNSMPVYSETPMRYDETSNKIYLGNNERFTLLSLNYTEMYVIEKVGTMVDYGRGLEIIYYYEVFQRMTGEELKNTRDHFWINKNDLSRPMTREDLLHKWVLMSYVDNNYSTHVSDDTKLGITYIQFFDDGTVEVKDGVGVTAYKGTFDVEFYDNESATIKLKYDDEKRAGGFFQKNVWKSKELRLTATAYLSLIVDKDTVFHLQRNPTD